MTFEDAVALARANNPKTGYEMLRPPTYSLVARREHGEGKIVATSAVRDKLLDLAWQLERIGYRFVELREVEP
jgi:hypothetical protein